MSIVSHSISAAYKKDSIRFYTLWRDDQLLGCGAIQELTPYHAELKSMRTHPKHLRQGVATHLLDYLLKTAKHSNYEKVSLETGKTPTLMQQFIYTRNLVS